MSEWFEITEEHREALLKEQERTGIGSQALLSRFEIEGLNSSIIQTWRHGATVRAHKHKWDAVISHYASLPDKPLNTKRPTKKDYVYLDEGIREKMNAEIARTGVGVVGLMRHLEERPKGFPQKLSNMISGTVRTAHKDQVDMVLEAWASLPDKNN